PQAHCPVGRFVKPTHQQNKRQGSQQPQYYVVARCWPTWLPRINVQGRHHCRRGQRQHGIVPYTSALCPRRDAQVNRCSGADTRVPHSAGTVTWRPHVTTSGTEQEIIGEWVLTIRS